jgi:molecular chaperone GrpE (heat shock protein)
MKMDDADFFEQIQARICHLQKTELRLQDELKKSTHDFERFIDNYALRIIDILDMIEMIKPTIEKENNATGQLIIKKVEKRLSAILQSCDVKEITFANEGIEIGKTRVLETQQKTSPEIPTGTIVKICRKGYQRANKTIRPADVITVA